MAIGKTNAQVGVDSRPQRVYTSVADFGLTPGQTDLDSLSMEILEDCIVIVDINEFTNTFPVLYGTIQIISTENGSIQNAILFDQNSHRIYYNYWDMVESEWYGWSTKDIVKITFSSISSLPQTQNNSKITSSMEVIEYTLSNPIAQTGDWTVTTSNGSVNIAGTINGTTNITLLLGEVY